MFKYKFDYISLSSLEKEHGIIDCNLQKLNSNVRRTLRRQSLNSNTSFDWEDGESIFYKVIIKYSFLESGQESWAKTVRSKPGHSLDRNILAHTDFGATTVVVHTCIECETTLVILVILSLKSLTPSLVARVMICCPLPKFIPLFPELINWI